MPFQFSAIRNSDSPMASMLRTKLMVGIALAAVGLAVGASAAVGSPGTKLAVRAAVLTKADATTWKGSVTSRHLGAGRMTLKGTISFRPDRDGENPTRSVLRFRVTFRKGWLSGCLANTVGSRPDGRYVFDGPGRITASSSSLRRYRGLKVHDGGLAMADDLTHIRPFSFASPVPSRDRSNKPC